MGIPLQTIVLANAVQILSLLRVGSFINQDNNFHALERNESNKDEVVKWQLESNLIKAIERKFIKSLLKIE